MPTAIDRKDSTARIVKVLIVDDHPIVRRGYSQLIEDEPGLECCGQAEDAEEAQRLVREHEPEMAIIDISLKGGSGLELIKCLKARGTGLKMLACSAHDEALFAERALKSGALGFINKQAAVDHLITAVRRVLAGEIYLSERMTARLLKRASGSGGAAEETLENRLSDRELEAFELIGQGMTTRAVAQKMHISPKTVDRYREQIKEKLNLANANELIRHATQWVLENR